MRIDKNGYCLQIKKNEDDFKDIENTITYCFTIENTYKYAIDVCSVSEINV